MWIGLPCDFMWWCRAPSLQNPLLQTGQRNGQLPVCEYPCALRSPGVGKERPHSSHLCGFSCISNCHTLKLSTYVSLGLWSTDREPDTLLVLSTFMFYYTCEIVWRVQGERNLIVRHAMVIQVGRSGKALSTHRAFMRTFTGMNPNVSIQWTACAKHLTTYCTAVWFLSWKRFLMSIIWPKKVSRRDGCNGWGNNYHHLEYLRNDKQSDLQIFEVILPRSYSLFEVILYLLKMKVLPP